VSNLKKRKLSPAATAGISVAIALLVGAAGWFLLISPQRARAAQLDEEIAAVEAQVTMARLASQQAEDVQPIRIADLFRLTKAMPSDLDMSGVLLELNRIASETGIQFESIAPGPTTAVGAFRVQPTELVFVGNFYTLSDFLYRLRTLVNVQRGKLNATGRLFSVEQLTFTEGDGGFPTIKAVLTVSAYLFGAGPTPGAAPPAAPAPATTATDGSTPSTGTAGTETTPSPDTPPAAPETGSAAGAP
jgi:Tfp pilus assembly protein PilO